jgi:RimJ/RimL family protein N-acetyltransferase
MCQPWRHARPSWSGDERPGNYDIWYFVRRDEWGKGIATCAVKKLLESMAASSRVKTISAQAAVDKPASVVASRSEINGWQRVESAD